MGFVEDLWEFLENGTRDRDEIMQEVMRKATYGEGGKNENSKNEYIRITHSDNKEKYKEKYKNKYKNKYKEKYKNKYKEKE